MVVQDHITILVHSRGNPTGNGVGFRGGNQAGLLTRIMRVLVAVGQVAKV